VGEGFFATGWGEGIEGKYSIMKINEEVNPTVYPFWGPGGGREGRSSAFHDPEREGSPTLWTPF